MFLKVFYSYRLLNPFEAQFPEGADDKGLLFIRFLFGGFIGIYI